MDIATNGIFNCDWLSFTLDFDRYTPNLSGSIREDFDPESTNHHLTRFFSMLDEQREQQQGGYLDLGLFSFNVLSHGDKSYYYILDNEDMQIKFSRYRANGNNYPVFIHFKSQFLWSTFYGSHDLVTKFNFVVNFVEDITGCTYLTSKINRLDLCYHTDTVPRDINTECFVGRHTFDDTIRMHRVVTGVNVGMRRSNRIFLRCYNKYLEARGSKKLWFFKIWEDAGLDVKKVWNIEFQMKREFFKEMKGASYRMDSVEDVIQNFGSIWYYLTNEWVTYRTPDNERRARWSIHPFWQPIMELKTDMVTIERGWQRRMPSEVLIPQVRGYLSSLAARVGGSLNDPVFYQYLEMKIAEYDDVKGTTFDETVARKRSLIQPEHLQDGSIDLTGLYDQEAYDFAAVFDEAHWTPTKRSGIDFRKSYKDQGIMVRRDMDYRTLLLTSMVTLSIYENEHKKIADAVTSTTQKAPKNSEKSPVSPSKKGCQLELFGI